MVFGLWLSEEISTSINIFLQKPKTEDQEPKSDIFVMYYDKEGNEINPALIPMPRLCADCDKKDDIEEEILCTLTRLDQRGKKDFVCYAYISRYGVLNDEIIQ